MFVPRASRRAYLPRIPREKSYSGCISGSVFAFFFMSASLGAVRFPGGHDRNSMAPFRVDDNDEPLTVGMSDQDETTLVYGMQGVRIMTESGSANAEVAS